MFITTIHGVFINHLSVVDYLQYKVIIPGDCPEACPIYDIYNGFLSGQAKDTIRDVHLSLVTHNLGVGGNEYQALALMAG